MWFWTGSSKPNSREGDVVVTWFLSHCIIILLNLIAPHTCIFEIHSSRWVMMMIWFGWLRYLPATELWRETGRHNGPWLAVHHSRCLSEPEPEVSLTQQPLCIHTVYPPDSATYRSLKMVVSTVSYPPARVWISIYYTNVLAWQLLIGRACSWLGYKYLMRGKLEAS